MTERILGPTGGRRRRLWLIGPIATLVVLVGLFVSSGAVAVTPCTTLNQVTGSNFEIDVDANLRVDGPADCIDWDNSGPPNNVMRSGVLSKPDKPAGSGDDSFGQGTAEDEANPTIVDGSIPPNKSDLKTFGVFTETTGGAQFLELFWSRIQNPSGTTNMDFELNQEFCDGTATHCANNAPANKPAVYVTPKRTAGDKLITYDLSKGGTVPTISIRTWSGSAWGPATVISVSSASAVGAVNSSTIASADSFIGAQDPFTFGEVALSYSAIFPSGTSGCGKFGSAYLKSRSSDSFPAELKDFIAPEPVQITNCSTIATSLSATSITVGGTAFDTATLTGVTSTAGGTVAYAYYTDSACTLNQVTAGTKTVTNGIVPNSNTKTFNTVGTFYWQAVYSGDLNNAGSTSDCTTEVLTVTKAQLTATTQVHNASHQNKTGSSVPLGSVMHDFATVSGAVSGVTPTGAITFTFYTQADCGGTGTSVTNTGTEGSGQRSADSSALAAGSYSYKASVAGDSNYLGDDSDCENFTVDKAQLTASTQVHNASHSDITGTAIAIGSVVHDFASVSGGVAGFTPSGAITFTFYTQADCGGTGTSVTNTGTEGSGQRSADSSALAAGSYSYKASVAGDSNYLGDDSDCENFTVNKANPTLGTAPTLIPNDSATISGLFGASPSGTLTFKLFTTSDCSGSPVYTETMGVTGNATYSTTNPGGAGTPSTYTISADATVRWTVDYDGDSNNAPASSGCTAEPVKIDIAPLAP